MFTKRLAALLESPSKRHRVEVGLPPDVFAMLFQYLLDAKLWDTARNLSNSMANGAVTRSRLIWERFWSLYHNKYPMISTLFELPLPGGDPKRFLSLEEALQKADFQYLGLRRCQYRDADVNGRLTESFETRSYSLRFAQANKQLGQNFTFQLVESLIELKFREIYNTEKPTYLISLGYINEKWFWSGGGHASFQLKKSIQEWLSRLKPSREF
jgi:hypothetical protein